MTRDLISPGETLHVSIPLDTRAFAYHDTESKKWLISRGDFGILVGASSEEVTQKSSVTLDESTTGIITLRATYRSNKPVSDFLHQFWGTHLWDSLGGSTDDEWVGIESRGKKS